MKTLGKDQAVLQHSVMLIVVPEFEPNPTANERRLTELQEPLFILYSTNNNHRPHSIDISTANDLAWQPRSIQSNMSSWLPRCGRSRRSILQHSFTRVNGRTSLALGPSAVARRAQSNEQLIRKVYTPPPLTHNQAKRFGKPGKQNKPLPASANGQDAQEKKEWFSGVVIDIDGEQPKFASIFLRDSCSCSACVDPSSKQKNFLTTDIPEDILGQVIDVSNEHVSISWTRDIEGFGSDHITIIPIATLRAVKTGYEPPISLRPDLDNTIHWSADDFEADCADVDYDSYMSSDSTLWGVLEQLRTHGLVFLTGVPEAEETVARIAERIGPVKNTLYGYTWDVRSVPNATNVAYTSKDLGFHMDLLPLKEAPALQLLHCIRSSAQGGNSLFTDASLAARDLWQHARYAFNTLSQVPVTFHYDHPETHLYSKQMPVIETSTRQDLRKEETMPSIHDINWSPPFQGPFRVNKADVRSAQAGGILSLKVAKWRQAAAQFTALIQRRENIYQRLMRPGQCVIFANKRILHARTAFEVEDAGKERWLRGCYLDSEVWSSRYEVLRRKFKQVD